MRVVVHLAVALLSTVGLCSATARAQGGGGAPDPSFGTSGVSQSSLSGTYDFCCVAQQPDGKLLVAGFKNLSPNPSRLVLRRHHADGSLDTGYGLGGEAVAEFKPPPLLARRVYGVPKSLVVQPDGKAVAAGFIEVDSAENGLIPLEAVWRFTQSGLLDTTFDGDGEKQLAGTNVLNSAAYDLDFSQGRLLVLYQETKHISNPFPTNHTYTRLARLMAGGGADVTFGGFSGSVQLDFNLRGSVVAVNQQNGLIHVGGDYQQAWSRVFRYTGSGSLDASYGSGGSTVPPSCEPVNYVRSLAVQPDGKLVGGGVYVTVNGNFASTTHPSLFRLDASGTADASFAGGGIVCLPCSGEGCPGWQGESDNMHISAELQAGGKIIVLAGDSSYPFLQRRNPDGSQDTSFTPALSSQGLALDTLVQAADGKVVVLAKTAAGYRLVRYLP